MDSKFKSCVLLTGTVKDHKPAHTKTCSCDEFVPYSPKGVTAPIMPFGNCIYCGLPNEEGNSEK